jgi:hypothetical protein
MVRPTNCLVVSTGSKRLFGTALEFRPFRSDPRKIVRAILRNQLAPLDIIRIVVG